MYCKLPLLGSLTRAEKAVIYKNTKITIINFLILSGTRKKVLITTRQPRRRWFTVYSISSFKCWGGLCLSWQVELQITQNMCRVIYK